LSSPASALSFAVLTSAAGIEVALKPSPASFDDVPALSGVTVLLEAKLAASVSCSFVVVESAAATFGDAGTDDTFILLSADTCSIVSVGEWDRSGKRRLLDVPL